MEESCRQRMAHTSSVMLIEREKMLGTATSESSTTMMDLRLYTAAAVCYLPGVEEALLNGANLDAAQELHGGDTALHVAARLGHLAVVKVLLDAGATIDVRDCFGRTPLHDAGKHYKLQVARELIRRGADIYARDADGETPLDRASQASRYGRCNPVEGFLLEHYREKLFESDGRHSLLSILNRVEYSSSGASVALQIGRVSLDQFLSLLHYLVQQNPDCLRERDDKGDLPLHVACRKPATFPVHADYEVIQFLLEQDPAAIYISNNNGALPIHVACQADASIHVVKILAEQDPDSIRERDGCGNLPLHIACLQPAPFPVIQYLVQQDSATLHISNRDRALPIHLACRAGASLQSIKYMVEENGGAATLCARDQSDGSLPLHRWCGSPGLSREKVEYMIKVYPAALSTRNSSGSLPLHVFCESSTETSLKAVECLIKPYPAALLARTSSGDLPVTLACESASLNVIYALIRSNPQVVST